MKHFRTPEQLLRLQHLVEGVLPHYGLDFTQLALLQYEDNAVYQITLRQGEHFVLRVSAAEGHSLAAQRSEMHWLMTLRREIDLLVPEPIPNDARIRALPADMNVHLRTARMMRDMINVNFILSSKNANVHTWGRQRLDQIIAQLEAYLRGSSDLGI